MVPVGEKFVRSDRDEYNSSDAGRLGSAITQCRCLLHLDQFAISKVKDAVHLGNLSHR